MNNKIRNIAESAGILYGAGIDGYYTKCYDGVTREQIEKFAELIIKDCIEICKTTISNSDDYNTGMMYCAQEIKEHFGIDQKPISLPKCVVCGTTENVRYQGGHQPWICDSIDCIPF